MGKWDERMKKKGNLNFKTQDHVTPKFKQVFQNLQIYTVQKFGPVRFVFEGSLLCSSKLYLHSKNSNIVKY